MSGGRPVDAGAVNAGPSDAGVDPGGLDVAPTSAGAVDAGVALLAREASSFVARLRLFTPARWQAGCPPYGTRADAAHHLAQWLADEVGEAPVRLPRLESDLALPDQLAVTADDLVRSGQPAHDAVAHLLLHRAELLDEPVPTGLVTALGETDERALLVRARRVCGAP